MFAGRFLRRLSRHQAGFGRIVALSKPQSLSSQRNLPSRVLGTVNSFSAEERIPHRRCFSSQTETEASLDSATYDRVCTDTLDALCDYFEELTEQAPDLQGTDVAYGVRRSAHGEPGTAAWHLRDQPADAQQTDLAELPHQRPQAIRLRGQSSGRQMGLQAHWSDAARAPAAGDTRHSEGPARGLPTPALL
ncbi:hypothetical protein KR009_005890, partial [Drosophila setifemur]